MLTMGQPETNQYWSMTLGAGVSKGVIKALGQVSGDKGGSIKGVV